ncbi:MAG: biotin/lipoyl-containing protein, partial [Burkholderiaceae bacterium]
MSNTIEIKVPDIGDAKDVEVIEVMVAVGDTIEAEQSLITLESDKSSMEIPASEGGVVKSISVKIGDKVSEGAVILILEAAGAAGEAKSSEAAQAPAKQAGSNQAPAGSTTDVAADEPEKQAADGATDGGSANATAKG